MDITSRAREIDTAHGWWMQLVEDPFTRLQQSPFWGKVAGVLLGWLQVWFSGVFGSVLSLFMVSSLFDWWFGRKAARKEGRYDPNVAHYGLHSKLSGIVLILLVRGLELALAGDAMFIDTRGYFATALALALFANDLESIHHHRVTLGAAPIPFLGRIIDTLKRGDTLRRGGS